MEGEAVTRSGVAWMRFAWARCGFEAEPYIRSLLATLPDLGAMKSWTSSPSI
jgi:hypothetical protein